MNVVVINGSPYLRRGNTAIIFNAFLNGVRENGGKVEIINLNKLTIHPCRGDLSCWFRIKNKCIQNDDMTDLLCKIKNADLIVFSTPVYCDGVPGQLKVLMNRMVVLGNPFLELVDNHTRHPFPPDYKKQRFVIIASCGLWEIDNFNPMLIHLKAFCKNVGFSFSGALLRPHAFALRNHDINEILHAAKIAGQEIIQNDKISSQTEDAISKTIIPREEYMENVNKKAAALIHL
jgi:multimeric flavodoxin WrbA